MFSPARLQLQAQARQRQRVRQPQLAAAPLSPRIWAEQHRRIDDQPFTLARHQPLQAIYDDDHPHIVVIKPAQVGVSELAVTRACHALDVGAAYWATGKAGLNVGYVFPTQGALGDFSKERISSIKRESEYLMRLFQGDFDDVTFKQAGASYLYLRGANSEESLLSFACDVLFLDEFDRMRKSAVALARKRLRASLVKREMDISTPTVPGVGIHAEYLLSDQRIWEVGCSCGAWSALDFFRDVRVDGEPWVTWETWDAERVRAAAVTIACPACAAELDRLGPGRWVAQQPGITGRRGYHVPWYAFPVISLAELAVKAVDPDPTARTEFIRSDLGLPYEPAGSRITDAMLRGLSTELSNHVLPAGPWRQTTMGVDVGARFHYRVSSTGPDGRRYVRAMGSVRTWDELDGLLSTYRVRRCVIDAMPELHACETFAAKHPGVVLRAWYPNTTSGDLYTPAEVEQLDDGGEVKINRTMAMDAVYSAIATGSEHWPAGIHRDAEVIAHMTAPVRVIHEDDRGQLKATWEHSTPDHLFHASVYDLIAARTLPRKLPGGPAAGLMGATKGWGA